MKNAFGVKTTRCGIAQFLNPTIAAAHVVGVNPDFSTPSTAGNHWWIVFATLCNGQSVFETTHRKRARPSGDPLYASVVVGTDNSL